MLTGKGWGSSTATSEAHDPAAVCSEGPISRSPLKAGRCPRLCPPAVVALAREWWPVRIRRGYS
jgi:hypothetical protein